MKRPDGTVAFYPRLPSRERLAPQPTREKAEAALAEALHQISERQLVRAVAGLSLEVWGRKCIERRRDLAVARGLGRRNTDAEMSRWVAHVETQPLGKMAVAGVGTGDILEWLSGRLKASASRGHKHRTLRRRPLAHSTVAAALGLVRMAFAEALRAQPPLRLDNPALAVVLPAERRAYDPWTWLTPSETQAFIAFDLAVAEAGKRNAEATEEDKDAGLFALFTGVRQGEQWTLHLRDCKPELGRVVVRFGGRDGELLLPTKSGRPREIQLLPPALAVLTRQIARLGQRSNPRGLLWPSTAATHKGSFRAEGQPPPSFESWIDGAGLTPKKRGERVKVTWHSLRHTFATLSLAGLLPGCEGKPWRLEKVSAYLGHTEVGVTQRYADSAALLLPEADEAHVVPIPPATPRKEKADKAFLNRWSAVRLCPGSPLQNTGGPTPAPSPDNPPLGGEWDTVQSPFGGLSREQLEGLAEALLQKVLAGKGAA